MFVSLATEHSEFAALLSTSNTVTMGASGAAAERGDYLRRQLRAASVRKFVLTKTDHVYLPKVFDSAVSCVSEGAPRMARYIEGLRKHHDDIQDDSIFEYSIGYNEPVTDSDMIDDLVNGRVLHADYGKWWRTEQRKTSGMESVSLLFWISSAEQIIADTRDVIVQGAEKGYLTIS